MSKFDFTLIVNDDRMLSNIIMHVAIIKILYNNHFYFRKCVKPNKTVYYCLQYKHACISYICTDLIAFKGIFMELRTERSSNKNSSIGSKQSLIAYTAADELQ